MPKLMPTLTPKTQDLAEITQAIAESTGRIAPVWPLRDYVAVNPFLGLSDRPFLDVHQMLQRLAGHELLMPLDYYQERYHQEAFTDADLAWALENSPQLSALKNQTGAQIQLKLKTTQPLSSQSGRHVWTLSEAADLLQGSDWQNALLQEISKFCAAHYDQGQASWASPWKTLSLFQSWREQSRWNQRLDKLGLKGFRQWVATLPETSLEAIAHMLQALALPPQKYADFLYSQLLSIPGWAAWAQYQDRQRSFNPDTESPVSDLRDLLAIKLAHELGLWRIWPDSSSWAQIQDQVHRHQGSQQSERNKLSHAEETALRYLCQQASEQAYRRHLLSRLQASPTQPRSQTLAQFVFCIDVRSERLRRHLERASEQIETYGFAGFFGLPIAYQYLGESEAIPHCPAPIQPRYIVHETLASDREYTRAHRRRHHHRLLRKTWKAFKFSALSCFSFVETTGLWYSFKLLSDQLGLTRPVPDARRDGLKGTKAIPHLPAPDATAELGIPFPDQIQLATQLLKNLGLRQFAPLIFLCGHSSQVTNNPYQAAYDCGACSGHSGAPNAQLAAQILNHPKIRQALAQQGFEIPAESLFVAAEHNTTRDSLTVLEPEQLPASHQDKLERLNAWIEEACQQTLLERQPLLAANSVQQLEQRSRDWSELRPEWGLAGNAALVIGSQALTRERELEGRVFLHHYDNSLDADGTVLEQLMTAPMVVSAWINLQYYASSLAAHTQHTLFGSGNKALHNVVGQFGIFEGNGGDLMTGLPLQSVHTGTAPMHEPLRLQVVIEATRERIAEILARQAELRALITHEWIALLACEAGEFYLYTPANQWISLATPSNTR